MRNLFNAVVITLLAAAGGCAPSYRGQPKDVWSKVVDSDILNETALQYYWDIPVPTNPNEFIQHAYLLDENLYCLSNNNRMTAIDAATGIVKWQRQITSPDRTLFRPAHYDNAAINKKIPGIASLLSSGSEPPEKLTDLVCVNSPTRLFVLDRTTGEFLRKITFNFTANTGGACAEGYYYVGGTDGRFRAILLNQALHSWQVGTGDLITSPLESYGGLVYCAGQDGFVYAFSAGAIKSKVWQKKLGGPVTAEMHADSRGLFVPCTDNLLYAFETGTGVELWDPPFYCQGPLRRKVQVSQNTVYQYADGDKFYAIDLATGRERWSKKEGRKAVGNFNGNVYLLDARRRLLVADEMLGEVRHILPTTGLDMFVGNVNAPAIYAVRRDGHVFCIRHTTAGRLRPQDLKTIRTTAAE